MEPQSSQTSQQPRKRRHQKPRVLLSCNTCRKDKYETTISNTETSLELVILIYSRLKCDRRKPCATCVKRHREASCTYGRERPAPANIAGSSTINDGLVVDDRLRSFDGRLRHLEDKISKKISSWTDLRDAELPCPTTRRSGSDTISCRAGSKTSLDLTSRRDVSPSTSSDTLFTNKSHWLAIMNDAVSCLL
jgi:hypothetical protein